MKYLLVALFAWLLVGCTPAGATMNAAGPALVHPNFPYAVAYDDQRAKSLMGPDWDLETQRKVTYELDFDNDGGVDVKAELPLPDLLLHSRNTSARLEVTTLLLDPRLAEKELRALLEQVIENGGGTRSLRLGFEQAAADKRNTTRLLDSEEATLQDRKGLVATLERAAPEQRQAGQRRSRLFLLRAPFDYYALRMLPPPPGSDPTNPASQPRKNYRAYKVLLMVAYSNSVEDFEAQYPEFLRLLGKLHLMNDNQFASYLGSQIARCSSEHSSSSSVDFAISALGEVSIDKSKGFDSTCLSSAVNGYTFAATGEDRKLSANFDLSKAVPVPEWLTKSAYVEQRPVAPVAPVAPAPAAPTVPATPPIDAPPATTPPDATTTPDAAAPQPDGASSPPSSSANSPESGSSSKP